MPQSPRQLFRDHALQQYMQRREKDVLPRFIAPPTFLFAWILLALMLLAGVFLWWERIPTTVSAAGIVPTQPTGQQVLVFLPASYRGQLHPGQQASVTLGNSDQMVTGTITKIEPGLVGPGDIQQRFHLTFDPLQVITQPSIAVTMSLHNAPPLTGAYAGSMVKAEIKIGSRRVLSLFPVFDQLIGDH